jgi:N utilization substance protein B
MGTRRLAREAALQFLFQDDFALAEELQGRDFENYFEQFCVLYQVNRKARKYMRVLLQGITDHHKEIDEIIRKSAKNWRLERLAAAERNVLRIGVYEMVFRDDVPAQVAINEAVEIAKRYASHEAPAFVNGILDGVSKKKEGGETP